MSDTEFKRIPDEVWPTDDWDEDDCYNHFEELAKRLAPDGDDPVWAVASEGTRVLGLTMEMQIMAESQLDFIVGGVAIAAQRVAFNLMAKVLGLSSGEALENAVRDAAAPQGETWTTLEHLREEVRKSQEWLDNRAARQAADS